VSAHIKAMEDTLGLTLFERTPKGMSLTGDGQRLFARAEQTLAAHRALLEEAARIKGRVSGKLRLGTASTSSAEALGRLLTVLSERYPEVEVALQHVTSSDLVDGIRSGTLDAGFYNEAGDPGAEVTSIEVGRLDIYLAAPLGIVGTRLGSRQPLPSQWRPEPLTTTQRLRSTAYSRVTVWSRRSSVTSNTDSSKVCSMQLRIRANAGAFTEGRSLAFSRCSAEGHWA